jgi:hypothetical protein
VRFDVGRLAHCKEQIGNTLPAADHGGKKLVNNFFVHEGLATLSEGCTWSSDLFVGAGLTNREPDDRQL